MLLIPTASLAFAAPSDADAVAKALSALASQLGIYVAVLAGTSGLAVALMEAYKKLFSIRGKFHRTAVIRWLSERPDRVPSELASTISSSGASQYAVQSQREAPGEYNPGVAYAELFHLTSGQKKPPRPQPRGGVNQWRGIDRAVFELDTAKMMSQVQDAADAVLNSPALYPELYKFLTRGAPAADADSWAAYLANSNAPAPSKKESDLYGRIRLLMRRQLDAFQCVTANRWEELNQLWAVIVGAAILFVALLIAADPVATKVFMPWQSLSEGIRVVNQEGGWTGVVLKALFGGALAPIAKDLLNSLSLLKFSKYVAAYVTVRRGQPGLRGHPGAFDARQTRRRRRACRVPGALVQWRAAAAVRPVCSRARFQQQCARSPGCLLWVQGTPSVLA